MKKEKIFIYGKHSVYSALNNPARRIDELILAEENTELKKSILTLLSKSRRKVKLKYVNNKTLETIIKYNVKHQGVLAKSYKLEINNYSSVFNKKYNFRYGVILDRLTDPNNIGAIYRSAKAFGINFIININKHTIIENSAILNSACGAFDNIKTFSTNNISNTIKNFTAEEWWTIGLDHQATNNIQSIIDKMKVSDKLLFVFGSEGKGIRRLIKKNCSFTASIPNAPNTQSINVSNAAAIIFYESFKINNKFN